MKRIFYVTSFIVVLLVGFLGVTYSLEYNVINSLKFELLGPEVLYIDVYDEYVEYGVNVYNNGEDISSLINIDSSSVNTDVLGDYKVRYEIDIDSYKEYIYREVKVVDRSSPVITFNGESVVYLSLGENYVEQGVNVVDNYDLGLNEMVKVEGDVNTSLAGEYEIKYNVSDSSGNVNSIIRKVIVK